jgi:EAL domain-containing protein (putative c-di-GMP-specific phosphodiesterase class I)
MPNTRHAFIVDDEPQVVAFVGKILAGLGFEAHGFTRVPEVEAAVTIHPPEVIILDLSLGNSDAVEMMRSLAASRFGGGILLISGHDIATLEEVRLIGERRRLRMLPFLRKPFRVEDLRDRLALIDDPKANAAGSPDLDTALRNNWLELWYQPKVDLRTMQICGAEALIRLRHPENGLVPPSAFLPGPGDPLYEPLTDFIVRRSLADWSAFATEPTLGESWLRRRLAINVPVSVLQSAAFIGNVRRHLPRDPRFPGLIVEITEDEAISDPDLAREVAVQLRLYNVHVSIDDFGVGHSTLARLGELPFDELKLDRSYVDGCARDARKRTTCKTVVDLAHAFGLTAVAEGVETAEDLSLLSGMGYDVVQGYYFAKPMQSRDFTALMRARDSGWQAQPV